MKGVGCLFVLLECIGRCVDEMHKDAQGVWLFLCFFVDCFVFIVLFVYCFPPISTHVRDCQIKTSGPRAAGFRVSKQRSGSYLGVAPRSRQRDLHEAFSPCQDPEQLEPSAVETPPLVAQLLFGDVGSSGSSVRFRGQTVARCCKTLTDPF